MGDRPVLAWTSGTHNYYEVLTAHRRRGVEPSQQTVCGKTAPRFGPPANTDDPDHDRGTWTCEMEQAPSLDAMLDGHLVCDECWTDQHSDRREAERG